MNETPKCKYENCEEPVNSPHDEEYCVFHASVEKKGISVEEFNKLIFAKINKAGQERGVGNFRGYIFPGDINFVNMEFSFIAEFGGAQFSSRVNFHNSTFRFSVDFSHCIFQNKVTFTTVTFKDLVQFNDAKFSLDKQSNQDGGILTIFDHTIFEKVANFHRAIFHAPTWFIGDKFNLLVEFSHSQFLKDVEFPGVEFKNKANFSNAEFGSVSSNFAKFEMTTFNGELLLEKAVFKSKVIFDKTEFKGELNCFGTEFHNEVNFFLSYFNDNINFVDNKIKNKISFRGIKLAEKLIFYFQRPIFDHENIQNIQIYFERVRFFPFAANFEGIKLPDKDLPNVNVKPLFIFRYCQLKDVYFTNDNMSLFSFFKSSAYEARHVASEWKPVKEKLLKIFPYDRKNTIPEEYLVKYPLEDMPDVGKEVMTYGDVEAQYREMKASLDYTKDYQRASWFYFNEFEMKRLALIDRIDESKSISEKIFLRLRYCLYSIYKATAGYGEKPLWSFWWFTVSVIIFSIWNLLSGLRLNIENSITELNYKISFSLHGFLTLFTKQFWNDFAYAALFTLYRVIPISYLPFQRSKLEPIGLDGLALSFLNSFILIILVIFIGIGLKRHFRRF